MEYSPWQAHDALRVLWTGHTALCILPRAHTHTHTHTHTHGWHMEITGPLRLPPCRAEHRTDGLQQWEDVGMLNLAV